MTIFSPKAKNKNMKFKSIQGNQLILLPLAIISITALTSRKTSYEYNQNFTNSENEYPKIKTLLALDLIRENLLRDNIAEAKILIKGTKEFDIDLSKKEYEDITSLLIIEACIKSLLMHAQELRHKGDSKTATLFEETACTILVKTKQMHNSRPCVQIDLKQLAKFARKYEATQFLKSLPQGSFRK